MMDRRKFLGMFGRGLLASTALPSAILSTKKNNPNIILILTDDQGYGDVSLHGNQVLRTPNIDKIGKNGVDLTRFYVNPVCAPTRANMMTGRYYYRTGVYHTSRGGAKMSGEEITIAELLQNGGYRTGLFGKWHLGDNYPMRPIDQGFSHALWHKAGGIGQAPDTDNTYFDPSLWKNDEKVETEGYCTDVFFDAAIDFMKDDSKKPFFAFISTNAPHKPLIVADKYVRPFIDQVDEDTAKAYGMIVNLDENIGKVQKFLQREDLEENTVVIFITDNGPNTNRYRSNLRGRKSDIYEGGIRAVSFFQWKNQWEGGRESDIVCGDIDVLPTVLDACDIAVPADIHIDGISLNPVLSGKFEEEQYPDRTFFVQCHRGEKPEIYQNAAVITKNYKLVIYPDTFQEWNFQTGEGQPELELYDLKKDPREQDDVSSEYREIANMLLKRYEAWFQDVKNSRNFQPGIIHIGNEVENPVHLCRYQDSHYKSGFPEGWPVHVEKSGEYEISINRGPFLTKVGNIMVEWKGETEQRPISAKQDTGTVFLEKGQGLLDIYFTLDGVGPIKLSDNGTTGDCSIRYIGS